MGSLATFRFSDLYDSQVPVETHVCAYTKQDIPAKDERWLGEVVSRSLVVHACSACPSRKILIEIF